MSESKRTSKAKPKKEVAEVAAEKTTKKKKTTVGDGPITFTWSLGELPTTQHRAGLAGLVLLVQWLARRERKDGEAPWICEIAELTEATATLRVDRAGMRVLFDHAFAASNELKPQAQKQKNKQKVEIPHSGTREIAEVDKDGKPVLAKDGTQKKKTYYLYPAVVPRGAFLLDADSTGESGPWIKLWRDYVWTIVRGVPTTRTPYEQRANSSGYSKDADNALEVLAANEGSAVPLKSTHFFGAQEATADNVSFCDRDFNQLLLTFSPFAIGLFVPLEFVRPDEANRSGTKLSKTFVVVVPDVSRLKKFCGRYEQFLLNRSDKKQGYRPAQAVVDVTTAGALEMSLALRDRVTEQVAETQYARATLGFDVIHVGKAGDNVRVFSTERFEPTSTVESEYLAVRDQYSDRYFRRQRLINLIRQRPWYDGFDAMAETVDCNTLFIGSSNFRRDAIFAFERENKIMTESSTDASLEDTVRKILKDYVNGKLDARGLMTREKMLDAQKQGKLSKDDVKEYDENVDRWTRDAFLAIRARKNRLDFVEYFVGSLCAGTHNLATKKYALIHDLIKKKNGWRELRTIALLACAAVPHWYDPKTQDDSTPTH